MENHSCFCVCQCVGCTALREAITKCDCATCQLLGFVPMSQKATPEHCCFMKCRCQTCCAVRTAAKQCECIACVICVNPQPDENV